jgi:hypothetical protein
MSAIESTVSELRRRRPEWNPWLQIVEAMLADATSRPWDAVVPVEAMPADGRPVLAGASLAVDAGTLRGTVDRLVGAVRASGRSELVEVTARFAERDAPALLESALCDAPTVIELLALPFFQACHRRHPSAGAGWMHAYCALCGAWPAFVEVLGIERTRQARCGRCGTAWPALLLRCRYCETGDHEQLVTLMPREGIGSGAIDACVRCGKYTKVLTRLQGCRAKGVYLEDLATVELDVAALAAGYLRPQGQGYPLAMTVRSTTVQTGEDRT